MKKHFFEFEKLCCKIGVSYTDCHNYKRQNYKMILLQSRFGTSDLAISPVLARATTDDFSYKKHSASQSIYMRKST